MVHILIGGDKCPTGAIEMADGCRVANGTGTLERKRAVGIGLADDAGCRGGEVCSSPPSDPSKFVEIPGLQRSGIACFVSLVITMSSDSAGSAR